MVLSQDFIRGVQDGTFSATGRPYSMPSDPSPDYTEGWIRAAASVAAERQIKAAASTTPKVQPKPVETVPANEMIGQRFILPIAKAETTLLLTTVCDRCSSKIDCSGEPFLRATFREQSLAVCGACGGSLEVIVIDDKLTAFKD